MSWATFKDALNSSILKSLGKPLAHFNNWRLSFPEFVYHGASGIGDDLLCTCIFRELKKRGKQNIVFRSFYPDLFKGNTDVDRIIRKKLPVVAPLAIHGLPFHQLHYHVPLTEHFLVSMCRSAGIQGEIAVRPYFFLSDAEKADGRLFDRQIAIQSGGLGANVPMKNKQWYPDRFQEVANRLAAKGSVIQLGTPLDPPLKGVLDLRGKTSLRQAAAILSNATVFVGQVGFLMHLARAVDCRSAIVYGGRETPQTTGYIANRNLIGVTPCSPCWEENKCDYDRECMKMVSIAAVVRAAEEQIGRFGKSLETEQAFL